MSTPLDIDRINKYRKKKGVTILLDMDGDSELSNMGSTYSYAPKSKELTIVVPTLIAKDKNLVLKLIRQVHEDGGLIWKQSKNEELHSFSGYSSNSEDKKTLRFFLGILTTNDYSALKMSIFIRDQSLKGKDILDYKKDIRDRFGDRGANISNLCSAGYFENEFMPLYNTVPKKIFNKYYEMVVGEKARALFVHSKMSVSDIKGEVKRMVTKAVKYHMQDFRVHGKGKINVENIIKFVKSLTGKEGYIIKKVYDEPKLVAIEFKVEINRE